jgi:hypothetical protein
MNRIDIEKAIKYACAILSDIDDYIAQSNYEYIEYAGRDWYVEHIVPSEYGYGCFNIRQNDEIITIQGPTDQDDNVYAYLSIQDDSDFCPLEFYTKDSLIKFLDDRY